MRFMVILKSDENTEAGALPSSEDLVRMNEFNEQLVKAGVLLGGEGLLASSHGAKVRFTGDSPSVVDGPFTEATELVAGFWLLEVSSKAEAVEWVKRVPVRDTEIEIRRVAEVDDFGEAATPEVRERVGRLRESAGQR
ncbi:YciI family protein [Amycolatopsis suaedae]|uniref:YciI family protein n=1 Tax=Amycolatopsis suaedae TaxID=2510978 RepID=A0A4Q7IXJ7_9PSEU|nr:YciI family protein [Amycolatopsis suaedae]RZQ59670.1 YciI family protein [Amycolatopsis suaedae]